MITPDFLNGVFEIGGAISNFFNIRKLHQDGEVKGVSLPTYTFWITWGFWNLYYYPQLNQMWSFIGGLLIVIMNVIWLFLACYYAYKKRFAQP